MFCCVDKQLLGQLLQNFYNGGGKNDLYDCFLMCHLCNSGLVQFGNLNCLVKVGETLCYPVFWRPAIFGSAVRNHWLFLIFESNIWCITTHNFYLYTFILPVLHLNVSTEKSLTLPKIGPVVQKVWVVRQPPWGNKCELQNHNAWCKPSNANITAAWLPSSTSVLVIAVYLCNDGL